jgi:integrase
MLKSKERLTEKLIQSLKATRGRVERRDADVPGFGIRVTADGRKTFFLRYGPKGATRLTLGEYPHDLKLEAARKMARARLGDVAQGRDPQAERRAARQGDTFAEVAQLYLDRSAKRQKKSWREDERKIRRDLVPALGKRKIQDIRRRDVIALVESIAEGGGPGRRHPGRPAPVAANRVLALVSRIFSFALERELLESNPAYRLRKPAKEAARERVLAEQEIAVLWAALDQQRASVASAWKLILLTGQRPGEVMRLRWSDLDQDLAGCWWTISAQWSKNGQAHRVPLTQPALEIIEKHRPRLGDSSEWILGSRYEGKRLTWLTPSTRRLLELTGLPRFTPHDLRRTAASMMLSLGTAPHVVEALLNHKPRGVAAVYQRYAYGPEMRRALDQLGNHIATIITGGGRSTVVRIDRAQAPTRP